MKLIKYLLSAAAVAVSVGTLWLCASGQETEPTAEITEPSTTSVTESVASTTSVTTETELTSGTTVSSDVTEPSVAPTVTDGWNLINGKWFYYADGVPASGLTEIDGETYIFAPNGAFKAGWQTINSRRTYFDYETHEPVYGWISYMGNTYYNDREFGKLKDMHEIDDNTYIFMDTGIMQTGFGKYQGFMYYCDENGAVVKGDQSQTPIDINGVKYIISPSGKVHLGWQTINGLRIYFDYETAEPVYGWINYNGKYFYTDAETGKYTGEHYINNRPYRFDEGGILQTGLQSFDDGKTCYYYEDGTWAVGFVTVEKGTRYFNADGFMVTGWQTINKNKYYFNPDGKMATGFMTIDGSRYYFSQKGIMQTGFVKIGKETYYFGSDGKMKTGWQTISKNKYYFGTTGIMATGFFKISGNTYYFGNDGIMQTGFHIIDGKYCNLGDNGILKPIKVFVGVGHGGYDPGAVGYIVEKEYTLKTAKVVEGYLKAAGIDYILSRDADIDTTMQSKLELCNKYDPDLIIDIHFNAAGGHGFEVYHSMYGGMSKTLAENINSEVSKIMYSNGCKTFINAEGKDRFTIIRETHAPAVLIEGGFVDNWSDAEFIKANYQKLAKAYAEGVLKTILLMFKGK